MSSTEKAIMTVLCMIYDGNKILLQDRLKSDWRGLTFPGGHVEKEESLVKDFFDLLKVFDDVNLNEFKYNENHENNTWTIGLY